MKAGEDEYGDMIWELDIDETAVTFNVTDNGYEMLGGQDVALGLCLDGEFYQYAESELTYTTFNAEKPVAPADAEFKPWSLQYGTPNFRVGHKVEAAICGNDIYVKGFWSNAPFAVAKGTIEGDKVRFPSDQYFGEFKDQEDIHYLIFMSNAIIVEDTYLKLYKTTSEDIVFDFDKENTSLTVADPAYNILVRKGNTKDYELTDPLAIMISPSVRENTPYVRPLAPTYHEDFYTEFENKGNPFVMLEFSVVPFDEDGNFLAAEDITYSVWADNNKVMFSADKAPNYEKLPEATDELPLSFVNKWGMANVGDNIFTRRRIQVFDKFEDKIGVQINFTDPETKEKKSSKIAYYHPSTQEITYEEAATNGISNSTTDLKVANTAYYNLNGTRVNDNFKGLCIKKVTYSDGTVETEKSIRR